jgi:hypothetical protein
LLAVWSLTTQGHEIDKGKIVIALDEKRTARREPLCDLMEVAALALAGYGLDEADISVIDAAEELSFSVTMPSDYASAHPYLGKVAGHSFAMRIRRFDPEQLMASRLEAEWLAALLRDSDYPAPEPVPACDGSLFPGLWVEGIGQMHSVLYRWSR